MKKKIIPSCLILVTIFVSVGCGNTVEKEEAERAIAAEKTLLKDDAINFGKAAETKYVSDSLSNSNMPKEKCYTVKELQENGYVSKKEGYNGKIIITANGDNLTANVYFTNGKYMVKNFTYKQIDDDVVLQYKDSWKTEYETCN